jgi:flagellar protein FliO/FliZ
MDVFALALRVILSLGVVLGVLWLVQRQYAHRSGLRGKGKDPMTVVSRRGIGQKASVVIVDMDGKRFMLGVTDQNINVLHAGDAPEPEVVPESSAKAFSRTLAMVPDGSSVDDQAVPQPRGQLTGWAAKLEGSILSPNTWVRAGQALGLNKGMKG